MLFILEGNGKSQRYLGHRWGNGCAHYVGQKTEENATSYTMQGGIYMASSVSKSCKVWNCSVEPEAVEHLGDIVNLCIEDLVQVLGILCIQLFNCLFDELLLGISSFLGFVYQNLA